MTPTLHQFEQLTNEKLQRHWDVLALRTGAPPAAQADARRVPEALGTPIGRQYI